MHKQSPYLSPLIVRILALGLGFAASNNTLLANEQSSAKRYNNTRLGSKHLPSQEEDEVLNESRGALTEELRNLIIKQNKKKHRMLAIRSQTLSPNQKQGSGSTNTSNSTNLSKRKGIHHKTAQKNTEPDWSPPFTISGTYRNSIQTYDSGRNNPVTEWANRLDFYGGLSFTSTDRVLFGLRPLDEEGRFTNYQLEGNDEGWNDFFNIDISVLYAEGNFARWFSKSHATDKSFLDFDFSIGRQPLNFQDGIMINDRIDSVGITKSLLFGPNASTLTVTALAGYNQIHRNNHIRDKEALLYGLFLTADYRKSLYELDIAYVEGSSQTGGDGAYLGFGQTKQFGNWSSTLRVNASWALDQETNAVSTGTLLTHQLSRKFSGSRNLFYLNSFYGIDDYASAARTPEVGGPLNMMGITYASPELGNYNAALGNQVGNNIGFALGYKYFLDGEKARKQLTTEIGARHALDGSESVESSLALAIRYDHEFNEHFALQLEGFAAYYHDNLSPESTGYGLRGEIVTKY